MITDDDLSTWERLASAASPGPWRSCGASDGQCSCCVVWSLPADYPILRGTNEDDGSGRWQDAAFAAAARTAVPDLCAEVRESRRIARASTKRDTETLQALRDERDALREALKNRDPLADVPILGEAIRERDALRIEASELRAGLADAVGKIEVMRAEATDPVAAICATPMTHRDQKVLESVARAMQLGGMTDVSREEMVEIGVAMLRGSVP
jgi:hypothetical protein